MTPQLVSLADNRLHNHASALKRGFGKSFPVHKIQGLLHHHISKARRKLGNLIDDLLQAVYPRIVRRIINFRKRSTECLDGPVCNGYQRRGIAGDFQLHLLDELEHSLGKNHKALKLSGRQNLARLFEQFGQLFGNAVNGHIQLLNHFGEFWSTQLIRRCLSDNFTQVSFNGRQRFELIQRAVHIQIGNQAASGIGVRQLLSHIEDFLCGDFRQITFNLFDYFRFVLAHGREHNAANTLDKDHFRSREHKVHGGNLFNLL